MNLSGILFDANILIDFVKTDVSVLKTISELAKTYIADVVLAEVDDFNESKATRYGVEI